MTEIKKDNHQFLLILHLLLGVLFYYIPFLTTPYSVIVFIWGINYIVKNKNRNNEALMVSGYVIAVEVFLRMTDATMINEYGKYVVVIFLSIGIYFRGFSNKSIIYLGYILLLCPALLLSTKLSTDVVFRKAISFNISGPVCLFFSAIYCIDRKILLNDILKVFSFMQLSLLTVLVYVIIFTPKVNVFINKTDSNFATSGGFGPNQVSTILGLGIFVSFALFLFSKNQKSKIIHLMLIAIFSYRALLTFSRGGFYTGMTAVFLLLIYIYFSSNFNTKAKISKIFVFSFIGVIALFAYTSLKTDGMIINRYTNKNYLGQEKQDKFSGREEIAGAEIKVFLENPVFGVGIGRNKEEKQKYLGHQVATHNEITRMLAEHGTFGLVAFLIIFLYPILIFFNSRSNFFFLSFYIFWFMTINHAAMRIAAPGFIYGLCLLKINFNEKPIVHRQ